MFLNEVYIIDAYLMMKIVKKMCPIYALFV